MKTLYFFIALISCLCLLSCGNSAKVKKDIAHNQNVEAKAESSDWDMVENDYLGPPQTSNILVDDYHRLVRLGPWRFRQYYLTTDGFYYCYFPEQPRYVIGLSYETQKVSSDEKEELRKSTGDTGSRTFFHPFTTDALANKFDRIDIVSNADFNEIPAGQSLASKFEFFSSSAWLVLQGDDYNNFDPWTTDYRKTLKMQYPFNDSFEPIHKYVSNLTQDDLFLLFYSDRVRHKPGETTLSACLVAKEVPEIKEHVFTISYYEGDKVWSVDIPAVFVPYIPEAAAESKYIQQYIERCRTE